MNDPALAADGLDHQLDPRLITLERIANFVFTAVVSVGSLLAIGIYMIRTGEDGAWPVQIGGWSVMVLLLAWHGYRWPSRAYAHTSYRVDDRGLEIRRGVYWRVVINLPRSRVQHIDVSQGPLERRLGLGTLVVYTAGTDYAKVELGGLEHGRALLLRDYLLPIGSSDAV